MGWLTDSFNRFSRNTERFFRRKRTKAKSAKRGKSRSPLFETLEARQLLTIDLSGVTQILANQSPAPAFAETGAGWQNYSETDAYGGNFAYHAGTDGSDGAAAEWNFSGLDPTQSYQCFVAYPAAGNGATNQPFTVADGSTPPRTTMLVNRADDPDRRQRRWHVLAELGGLDQHGHAERHPG